MWRTRAPRRTAREPFVPMKIENCNESEKSGTGGIFVLGKRIRNQVERSTQDFKTSAKNAIKFLWGNVPRSGGRSNGIGNFRFHTTGETSFETTLVSPDFRQGTKPWTTEISITRRLPGRKGGGQRRAWSLCAGISCAIGDQRDDLRA